MTETKSNKERAVSFLKLAASGRVDEAYSQYVHPTFKHHNQYFKGDKESLMTGMKESSRKMPAKSFEVCMTIEEKDKVVVFSHIELGTDGVEIAVVHILKFKDERVVELWDIGQQISKDSPNKNGMV